MQNDHAVLVHASVATTQNPQPLTDVSHLTYAGVSNTDFLRTIFAAAPETHRPFVVNFAGNPHDAPHRAWAGRAFNDAEQLANPAHNHYFTLAVYKPELNGSYKRQKRSCAGLYGVMLDDVGSKAVQLQRLEACPPSWVIETSADNYQAGYLFTEPLTDLQQADALQNALIAAGLCDPGANGPTARLSRLPVATNGKHNPPFKCRLTEWHPERRYTVPKLVKNLGLNLNPLNEQKNSSHDKPPGNSATVLDVYTPRDAVNAVIRALRDRGLYKSPLGDSKHDITCPWVNEHTGQVDHGAAYFEPSDSYPIGGFKCMHSHGDGRRIGTLLEFLGVNRTDAKNKPTIRVSGGELHNIVDAAERELASTERYYQRGGLIVSVTADPTTSETSIRPLSQPALTKALSSATTWAQYDRRSKDYIVTDPPARHVGVLYESETYQHLPALSGLARQPYLRPDSSIVLSAGFDSHTGMYGVFNEQSFSIPNSPGWSDSKAALDELRQLLVEFEFATPCDEAAAVAGILTAAIRPSLPLAPMLHVKAPQIASGKSYLTALIAAFASPTPPAALAFPGREEECEKLLLSSLLTAPAVVIFDNLTTDLIPYRSLCSAITEEYMTGRILGVSKTATVGTRTLFLSSGNNVDAVRDMARRTLTINLAPQCETPATRRFTGDPVSTVRSDRERFVSLAMTVVLGWIAAGSPISDCKSLASFTKWTEWVRQPLVWLGMQDPAGSIFETMSTDPDRETLGRLLYAWNSHFGNAPTMTRQVVDRTTNGLEDAPDLREAIADIAEERGQINRRRLGRWISRHQERIVDGMKFTKASGTSSAERWCVQSVTTVSKGQARATRESVPGNDVELFN